MDEDLERLLSNPFESGDGTKTLEADRALTEHAADITSRAVHDYTTFRKEIEGVMRPHIASGNFIEERLLSPSAPQKIQDLIREHHSVLRVNLEELRKTYRTYIETASDAVLSREAERLKRRYFQEEASPAELEFIKLKRFYEKVRTFNDFAKKDWREVQKLVDTLSVINESRSIVSEIANDHLRSINLLLRQTDSFLDALKLYMQVEEETLDNITGSRRTVVTYRPEIIYTLPAFFGDAPAAPVKQEEAATPEEPLRDEEDGPAGSLAKSIILETTEHKLNRASFFQCDLIGSRDWNRTHYYVLQVPVAYYDECVQNFRAAYQVNLDPENVKTALTAAAAMVRGGEGEKQLEPYIVYLQRSLDRLGRQITTEDFPGLEKPLVFLYHCGPQVIYSILVAEMNHLGLGEIFYLDSDGYPHQELPEELIKRTLVDWWNDRMGDLTGEDVDSYLTYSRAVEFVKKDYRALYDEGSVIRKNEQPGASYVGFEKWMKKNKARVFGARKIAVFKRFLSGTVLD